MILQPGYGSPPAPPLCLFVECNAGQAELWERSAHPLTVRQQLCSSRPFPYVLSSLLHSIFVCMSVLLYLNERARKRNIVISKWRQILSSRASGSALLTKASLHQQNKIISAINPFINACSSN